jgi:hypothetical protein
MDHDPSQELLKAYTVKQSPKTAGSGLRFKAMRVMVTSLGTTGIVRVRTSCALQMQSLRGLSVPIWWWTCAQLQNPNIWRLESLLRHWHLFLNPMIEDEWSWAHNARIVLLRVLSWNNTVTTIMNCMDAVGEKWVQHCVNELAGNK